MSQEGNPFASAAAPQTQAANPYAAPQANLSAAVASQGEQLTLSQIWFSFEGRIPRKAYWMKFFLPLWGLVFAFGLIGAIFKAELLVTLLQVIVIWPSLAAGAKRMHDLDKSGWWQLLSLIPVLGLVVLYWFCKRGTEGDNRFGGDATGMY
jgi:uncharacterized membrane protein YhaH (DUF805 family)